MTLGGRSEKWVYRRVRKEQVIDLVHGNLPPYMEEKFYSPQCANEEMEKQGRIVRSQNHNFRCTIHLVLEECQCYLLVTGRKTSNRPLQPDIESYCLERMERRPQACLGNVIIPLPFNYN